VLVAVAKIIEERIKIELRPAEYRGWNDDAAGRASEATGAVGRVVEREMTISLLVFDDVEGGYADWEVDEEDTFDRFNRQLSQRA